MEKEAFEPTGLIPRSIIRTVDRFVQQLLPGREKIALQEYRVSRYQILVSIKSLATLVLLPLLLNFTIKALLFTPAVEHFWNLHQAEIFLNSYQEKRAFAEMHDFSEKMFFESLLIEGSKRPFSFPNPPVIDRIKHISHPSEKMMFYKCKDPLRYTDRLSMLSPGGKENEALHVLQIGDLYARGLDDLLQAQRSEGTKTNLFTNLIYGSTPFDLGVLRRTPEWSTAEHAQTEYVPLKDLHAELCSQSIPPLPLKERYERYEQDALVLVPKAFAKDVESLSVTQSFRVHDEDSFVFSEEERYQSLFRLKSLELAKSYNKQSILAITNLLGDFLSFFIVSALFKVMRPELIILKSFLTESVYSLSDTTKSFLLILGMDLLVGFHSPRGWELALEAFLRHLGLPENENFILLFVALFPVFLDTVFKYWIFRYLNKISPSTVVTYHSMIE